MYSSLRGLMSNDIEIPYTRENSHLRTQNNGEYFIRYSGDFSFLFYVINFFIIFTTDT